MASEPTDVPAKHVIGVHYPGVVRNLDAAMETIGGGQGVIKAAVAPNQTSAVLPLNFRPRDPLSHPVFGDNRPTRGLLLRVTRKRNPDSAAPLRTEVVARVSSMFCFTGMADFQFVADSTLPTTSPGSANADGSQGPLGSQPEPLLVVPPLFTRQDLPMEYQFRGYYGEDQHSLKAQGGKSKGIMAAHVLKAIALHVPPAVQLPELLEGSFKPERRELLTQLYQLFSERPIWTTFDLLGHIKITGRAISHQEMEIYLPRLAYTFRTGAFMGLWIRRGYDPRIDPASRKYQGVEYGLPPIWAAKLKPRPVSDNLDDNMEDALLPPVAQTYSDISSFSTVPRGHQRCVLQVCDIEDLHVSSLLQDSNPPQQSCKDGTGWFSPADWDLINTRVAARFQSVLDRVDPRPAVTPSAAAEETNSQQPMEVDAPAAPLGQPNAELAADPVPNQELSDMTIEGGPSTADATAAAAEEGSIVPEGVLQDLIRNWPAPQTGAAERETNLAAAAQDDADNDEDEFEIFENESDEDEDDEQPNDEDDLEDGDSDPAESGSDDDSGEEG